MDYGPDRDGCLPGQPVSSSSSSHEEKVNSLTTIRELLQYGDCIASLLAFKCGFNTVSGIACRNPRCEEDAEKYAFPFHTGTNVSEASKAVLAYEKAEEILRRSLTLIGQSCLHLVQIHHAQCVMLESSVDGSLDKELEPQGDTLEIKRINAVRCKTSSCVEYSWFDTT